MKQLHRFFRSGAARITLAALLGIAVLAGLYLVLRATPQAHQLGGDAQQMRNAASGWTGTEKDGSELLRDLRAGAVRTVGIAANAILVSTTGC